MGGQELGSGGVFAHGLGEVVVEKGVLDVGNLLVQGVQTLVVLLTEEERVGVVYPSGGERGLGRESALVRVHYI